MGPSIWSFIRSENSKELRKTNDSWKLDETYVKIKGKWKYLYRAVDKEGKTLDFYLSSHRDQLAASRFLKKLLLARHTITPRVINTDENPSYIPAIESAKETNDLPRKTEHRKVKYLNNRIECDHRRIKRLIKYGLGFHSFRTGYKTIRGYESMCMIRIGQVKNTTTYLEQVKMIGELFGVAV